MSKPSYETLLFRALQLMSEEYLDLVRNHCSEQRIDPWDVSEHKFIEEARKELEG